MVVLCAPSIGLLFLYRWEGLFLPNFASPRRTGLQSLRAEAPITYRPNRAERFWGRFNAVSDDSTEQGALATQFLGKIRLADALFRQELPLFPRRPNSTPHVCFRAFLGDGVALEETNRPFVENPWVIPVLGKSLGEVHEPVERPCLLDADRPRPLDWR